jgi:hypothetical protein
MLNIKINYIEADLMQSNTIARIVGHDTEMLESNIDILPGAEKSMSRFRAFKSPNGLTANHYSKKAKKLRKSSKEESSSNFLITNLIFIEKDMILCKRFL